MIEGMRMFSYDRKYGLSIVLALFVELHYIFR